MKNKYEDFENFRLVIKKENIPKSLLDCYLKRDAKNLKIKTLMSVICITSAFILYKKIGKVLTLKKDS